MNWIGMYKDWGFIAGLCVKWYKVYWLENMIFFTGLFILFIVIWFIKERNRK